MVVLRRVINTIVDIVYPATCIICKGKLKGKSCVDNIVCAECWGKIKKNLPPFCHSCGRQLETKNITENICPTCKKTPLHFDRAFSPCVYEGTARELIHQFKYKGKDYLAPTLCRLMIEFIKEYNLPVELMDFIIPLPLHKSRMREREFNQAQILSNRIGSEFNKCVYGHTLKRIRNTKTQTELETEERFLNVRNSFSVAQKEEVKGKNILLVDDVLTTGATASEAAHTLKSAGANIVFVLTLAN